MPNSTDPSSVQQTLSLQKALDLARQHHTAGRLPEAEDIYQQILQTDPNHPVALNLLGVIAHQKGENGRAVDLISKAIDIKPDYAKLHFTLGSILGELGRLDEAVSSYRKALIINPDYVEAYSNLGSVFRELGQFDEAVYSCRKTLDIKPDYAEGHYNLGNVLRELDRLDEAVGSYQKAIDIKPDFAEAHCNLGSALQDSSKLEDAVTSYRKALATKPDYAEAYNNLGVVLQKLSKPVEAATNYRKAIAIKPDYTEVHINLGNVLQEFGKLEDAATSYRKALELNPNNIQAHVSLANNLDRLVPQWHTPMMNDQPRNEAYLAGLQTAIKADTHVLEIGTGFGLLAMMAARCGAEHVTTCEVSPLIAATAKEIIATNGMADAINVITKKSTDLEVGADMPRPADLLVHEIFSSDFLGEGVLSSVEDAKRRLLSPEGKIIPSSSSIMIALFGGNHVGKIVTVNDVIGFDMSKSNSITPKRRFFKGNHLDIKLLTEDVEAFNFDFNENSHVPPEEKLLKISIATAANCYGIIQWNRIQMDDSIVFENHPSIETPVSSWTHVAYVFDQPISVKPNQTAIVSAMHNRISPWFALEDIEDP